MSKNPSYTINGPFEQSPSGGWRKVYEAMHVSVGVDDE